MIIFFSLSESSFLALQFILTICNKVALRQERKKKLRKKINKKEEKKRRRGEREQKRVPKKEIQGK